MKSLSKIIFLLCIPFLLNAQVQRSAEIKYISPEFIYIAAGSKDGVAVKDTLSVTRDKIKIASIEVVHASENSASCRVIEQKKEVRVDDTVLIRSPNLAERSKDSTIFKSRVRKFSKLSKKSSKLKTRVSGYASAQGYWFQDQSNANFDFSQPSFRFKLKARNVFTQALNFNIKFRSRYARRSQRFSGTVPTNEWRNRLYEAALIYENPDVALNARIGRIISPIFSGIGYIDGLLLQHNINTAWNWGVFGGTQPEWQYSAFQTSYQKYGSFISYQRGSYSGNRFDISLAAAGVYHSKIISREFLYIRSSYSRGRNWNIYQSLELDVNRGWRRARSNETIGLSGLFISGQYRVSNWLRTSLSYDNRKNYYTYELRSLADSLFDDAFRQGLRSNLYFTLNRDLTISANFGLRHRETESRPTYTYGLRLNKRNLFWKRFLVSARFSGFDNFFSSGYNPSLDLTQRFVKGHLLSLSYGTYLYTLKADQRNKLNQWLRISGQYELPLNLYLNASYEYDIGDDVEGQRIFAELGYYF